MALFGVWVMRVSQSFLLGVEVAKRRSATALIAGKDAHQKGHYVKGRDDADNDCTNQPPVFAPLFSETMFEPPGKRFLSMMPVGSFRFSHLLQFMVRLVY